MDLRPLGATGILVSPIGLGTVKLGRSEGVKYPHAFTIPGDDEAGRLLSLAAELGVNLLDTAPAYGTSEARLGTLLAGQRERWIIATKAGEEFFEGRSTFDFTPRAIRASVERSLRRLRTDRVEICLLHSDGEVERDAARFDAALEELRSLRQRGLVRAFGASTKTPEGARHAIERSDVVMLTVNREAAGDLGVLDLAASRRVGVLAKKALASGRLAGQAGEALRFALSFPAVSSVVVGTISHEHLRANIAALEGESGA